MWRLSWCGPAVGGLDSSCRRWHSGGIVVAAAAAAACRTLHSSAANFTRQVRYFALFTNFESASY